MTKAYTTFRVLEPSFGDGAFVFALMDVMRGFISADQLPIWCDTHLFGCEIDDHAFARFAARWQEAGFGAVPKNMERCDFFRWMPPGMNRSLATDRHRYFSARPESFDLILGNPPFGGSISPDIQDELDALFGLRDSRKIKKETYAFFIVKGIDLLKSGGQLVFICSDTILTIPTMTGLRAWVQEQCSVDISEVPGSFAETDQKMLVVTLTKRTDGPRSVTVFGTQLRPDDIELTPNRSWQASRDLAKYFTGPKVGDFLVATSGMTIGNNELFLRRVESDGEIEEPYNFSLITQPVTVANEIARARLGKVAPSRLREVAQQEADGLTEPSLVWRKLDVPRRVKLPHPDYRPYNKAVGKIGYCPSDWVIFWRDEGAYVYTFKKNGNWYLHGVGGKNYFGREGLTWSLIAPRIYARYLPAGHILDSGAPCAFLRPGVLHDELYFVMGWALTDLCTLILKEVLNHTRNIQSKDFERLPYPIWVSTEHKRLAVDAVKRIVALSQAEHEFTFDSPEIQQLNDYYKWQEVAAQPTQSQREIRRQLALL
jgi:hypothetical protein